jgi:hypothetical protein
MLAPSWSREIALSRFSVSCVCFWHRRVINTNNLGARLGFYIPSRKRVPVPPWEDASCCLIMAAPRFGRGQQLSWSANELRLQNFLTTWVKELWRRDHGDHVSFVHKPWQETSWGWPSNVLVVGILEAVWCVNETCQVTQRESRVLIHSSGATSYSLRWN